MRVLSGEVSAKGFLLCVCLVVAGLLAFPCYQAFLTGGYIFSANAMDESSHLSYSYAEYVALYSGRMRYSSYLVILLHRLGLSGGYINVLFDAACTISTLYLTKSIFLRLGYSPAQARAGALLCFLLPLLFTPFNPVVRIIAEAHFDPQIMKWLSMPWNPEMPFIRTPEPQLSWFLIVAVLSMTVGTRLAPFALLAITPLVYPFVRLPLIFTCVVMMMGERMPLVIRLIVSTIACGAMVSIFSHAGVEQHIAKFFIHSYLPLVPFTGALALAVYLIIRNSLPRSTRPFVITLVCSPWVVANTQLITGVLIAPVNFENYWGVVVLGVLATLGILHRSEVQRGYVAASLLLFGAFALSLCVDNYRISARLTDPERILPLLAEAAPQVACDDLYLATFLDLTHPLQPPTAFSWTRTFFLSTDRYYNTYQCDRLSLERDYPELIPNFLPLFETLDSGFVSRGGDMFMSLGRQPIPRFLPQQRFDPSSCEAHALVAWAQNTPKDTHPSQKSP